MNGRGEEPRVLACLYQRAQKTNTAAEMARSLVSAVAGNQGGQILVRRDPRNAATLTLYRMESAG